MKFPFTRFEIEGSSMAPSYKERDRVVVFRCLKYQPGDVVVVEKNGKKILKRVVSLGLGGVLVHGDNSCESTDSRDFGPISPRVVLGKVIWHY